MEQQACGRCGRMTSQADLRDWTETERNRVFSGLEGGDGREVFRYVHQDRVYRVCPPCFAELSAGAPFHALAQKRSVVMLVAIFVAIAALAAVTPFILPALMSAFWRT